MKNTTITVSNKVMINPEDWITINDTVYHVLKVNSNTMLTVGRVHWWHKLWRRIRRLLRLRPREL